VFVLIFVLSQIRFRNPLVPHQIFQNPLVFGANAVTLLLYFALNGILFYLILNLQQIQGFSPSAAGLGLLASFLVISIFSGPAGSLSDRIGPRLQMILGPAIVACGAAFLSVFGNQADYFSRFLPGLVLVGAGMSLVIAPLTKSALMVKPEFSGIASGVNNAVARYAALLAIAILGAVMLYNFTANLQAVIPQSGLSGVQQQQILDQSSKLGGIVIPPDFDGQAAAAARTVIADAFIYAFRWAMAVCAFLAAASSIVSVLTIHNPRKALAPGEGEDKSQDP
jgi:hypothetical protein